MRLFIYLVATLFMLLNNLPCHAKNNTFAILGKSGDDFNFQAAATGCAEMAQKNGDTCIDISPKGSAHPRAQSEALQHALNNYHLSGIAISVVHSNSLTSTIKQFGRNIPIISFDSPFLPADRDKYQLFIGPNNFDLGTKLAAIAKRLRPEGGTICIMSDRHDPNLRARLHGVRMGLSLDYGYPVHKRLNGENNWFESSFSPLNAEDDITRTMKLVYKVVNEIKPDVFISVGHWPLLDIAQYRDIVAPHKKSLEYKRIIILCGTGNITPSMKKLADDDLLNGIVGFNFNHIGQLCYKYLNQLNKGKALPAKVIVPTVEVLGNIPKY